MKRRVLCIISSMNTGGAETFIMKLFRASDSITFDFCISGEGDNFYADEIAALGGRIFKTPAKSKNPLRTFFAIRRIVRENNIDTVMRVSEHSLASLDLVAAALGGAKTRIFRSTNSRSTGGAGRAALHKLFRFMLNASANVKIAPSDLAAEYAFGKRLVKKGKVCILNNGIRTDDYTYSDEKRRRIRDELGIPQNALVIGHVGRFMRQKNHGFLIDVFKSIHDERGDAVMTLTGVGEDEPAVREKVKRLGLEKSVLFLGTRSDMGAVLSAADIYVFPSLYEGMPNTVIEAQASGLKCLISDTITRGADITGLVEYMSLESGPQAWARRALDLSDGYERPDQKQAFAAAGYDIDAVAEKFERLISDKH